MNENFVVGFKMFEQRTEEVLCSLVLKDEDYSQISLYRELKDVLGEEWSDKDTDDSLKAKGVSFLRRKAIILLANQS